MSSRQIIRDALTHMDIAPQDTGSSVVNGGGVDRQGYDNATVHVFVGATDETVDFHVEHDDDDGAGSPAGTWADITGAAFTQFSATDDNKNAVGAIDLKKGIKRHLRVVCTPGGGTASLVCAAIQLSNRGVSMADADHGASPAGLAFNI